jgi:hypothetical protein
MTKQQNKSSKEAKEKGTKYASQPAGAWIPMRTGLIIITIISVVMAVLTAWQAVPIKGWVEGILWGVLFGGSIWVIFLGFLLYGRLFRKE